MTIGASFVNDNPCRPRHFKPPPCAPVVPAGPAWKALEACRTRLFFTSVLFACVFAAVALRVVEIVLLAGGTAQSHMPRFRIPLPPTPARADIVDYNGRLLATTLDSPSVYANPKQILDPADATRKLLKAFPNLNADEVYIKLTSGKSFVYIKRRLTPREQYEVSSAQS